MEQSMTTNVFSLVASLFFVVGLIVLSLYLLKKSRIMITSKLGAGHYKIDVLNSVSLGRNRYVTVIKVKDKEILLGVTEHTVNKLDEWQDLDKVAEEEADDVE